jgi:urease gamma subunit
MIDKIYKALVIIGIVIGLGVAFERLTATTALAAALEVRLMAVEKQTAENAANGRVTAELLKQTAEIVRQHEVKDAATTAQVEVNTKLLEKLTGR